MRIIVLLSTYNGEKFLREQLNSLVTQKLKPDQIFIRDDGSTDATMDIIKYYADSYKFIKYYQGENLGAAKSFMELINRAEEADFYALCDQDDVWFEDKLQVAVSSLETVRPNDIPLLYCSRFTLTDEKLNPLDSEISKLYGYTDYAHALLFQTAPGCTFVFNKAAREEIIKYNMNKEYCIIHDSVIHKVCAMLGKVILDENSYMFYRQHGNNEIGLSADEKKNFIKRVKRFFTGELKHYRRDTALSLLNVYGDIMSEENRELTDIVAHYDVNGELSKKLRTMECFKTHSINDFYFKLLVLFRYI